uniref:Uncharacterized protein n=1 Tax=Rhizophora mucronata TaxID=61149 RepID=A0A2P2IQK5_RHIMU
MIDTGLILRIKNINRHFIKHVKQVLVRICKTTSISCSKKAR